MVQRMFQNLSKYLHEHPLTTTGFLAFWAKVVPVIVAFNSLNAHQVDLLNHLGNDLAQLFAMLGVVGSLCISIVAAARELWSSAGPVSPTTPPVIPPGHVLAAVPVQTPGTAFGPHGPSARVTR